jgi:hypothetical protein
LLALAAAACGGKHDTAALVDGTAIPTERVDRILNHAREEAAREGKDFPEEGTDRWRQFRRQALDLLVYHEELEQRAKALGITLSENDLKPVPSAGTEEEGSQDQAFVRESLRGAILYRRLYERVTKGVSVSAAEIGAYRSGHPEMTRPQIRRNLLDTKRNALMARWIAQLKRDYASKVEYEAEFRKE